MMMNIRGIAFDDPNGTDNLKLPTIHFTHDSDSEHDMGKPRDSLQIIRF